MAQAQMRAQREAQNREGLTALECKGCELFQAAPESAGRRDQPTAADRMPDARACPDRATCCSVAASTGGEARGRAAQRLAEQAEEEALRFLKMAALLRADVRSTKAKQRSGWLRSEARNEAQT